MGSTRLPGKVLKNVLDSPLIAYEIKRLRQCESIEDIILATSDMDSDAPIVETGKELGVKVFQGNESDVLDRYYQASKLADTNYIMRATGDCPLIDPGICDSAVRRFFEKKADYIVTSSDIAEGLDCEVFTAKALKTAWENATLSSEREHVTLFIRNRPKQFNCIELPAAQDDSRYRVTVDEPEDFFVVKKILENLVPTFGLGFTFDQVRDFLDSNPEIAAHNSRIIRNEGLLKSLNEENQQ